MTPETLSEAELKARELLAAEYERHIGEGPYPTYAELARKGQGSFTMCSIRAVEAALLSHIAAKALFTAALARHAAPPARGEGWDDAIEGCTADQYSVNVRRIKLADGKYELRYADDVCVLTAWRHGEPWQDFTGNKLLGCMFGALWTALRRPALPDDGKGGE